MSRAYDSWVLCLFPCHVLCSEQIPFNSSTEALVQCPSHHRPITRTVPKPSKAVIQLSLVALVTCPCQTKASFWQDSLSEHCPSTRALLACPKASVSFAELQTASWEQLDLLESAQSSPMGMTRVLHLMTSQADPGYETCLLLLVSCPCLTCWMGRMPKGQGAEDEGAVCCLPLTGVFEMLIWLWTVSHVPLSCCD